MRSKPLVLKEGHKGIWSKTICLVSPYGVGLKLKEQGEILGRAKRLRSCIGGPWGVIAKRRRGLSLTFLKKNPHCHMAYRSLSSASALPLGFDLPHAYYVTRTSPPVFGVGVNP
jgi:hypothetical protein